MASATDDSILTNEEKEELLGYDFPFENIVFEAGGAKGIAYIGALRVSKHVKQMRRLCLSHLVFGYTRQICDACMGGGGLPSTKSYTGRGANLGCKIILVYQWLRFAKLDM